MALVKGKYLNEKFHSDEQNMFLFQMRLRIYY